MCVSGIRSLPPEAPSQDALWMIPFLLLASIETADVVYESHSKALQKAFLRDHLLGPSHLSEMLTKGGPGTPSAFSLEYPFPDSDSLHINIISDLDRLRIPPQHQAPVRFGLMVLFSVYLCPLRLTASLKKPGHTLKGFVWNLLSKIPKFVVHKFCFPHDSRHAIRGLLP